MVEVTRLRASPSKTQPGVQEPSNGVLPSDRFIDMLCSKLGQLLPKRSNLLLVGVESSRLTDHEISTIMLRIQQRAEGNDLAVIHKHGFRDRPDFFQHYQRLSAILVRGLPLDEGEPVVIWDNPQAKYPLPTKVRTALHRSHTT